MFKKSMLLPHGILFYFCQIAKVTAIFGIFRVMLTLCYIVEDEHSMKHTENDNGKKMIVCLFLSSATDKQQFMPHQSINQTVYTVSYCHKTFNAFSDLQSLEAKKKLLKMLTVAKTNNHTVMLNWNAHVQNCYKRCRICSWERGFLSCNKEESGSCIALK